MKEEEKYQSASEGDGTTRITVTTATVVGAVTTIMKWLWPSRGVNWFRMLVGSGEDAKP